MKVRKIKEGSRLWKRRLKEVVDLYRPAIVNCKNCGSPRHSGFTCQYCEKE
jgi:ribosomal protein L32